MAKTRLRSEHANAYKANNPIILSRELEAMLRSIALINFTSSSCFKWTAVANFPHYSVTNEAATLPFQYKPYYTPHR